MTPKSSPPAKRFKSTSDEAMEITSLSAHLSLPHHRKNLTILDLPFDVLVIIFRLVYDSLSYLRPHIQTGRVRNTIMKVHPQWASIVIDSCPWLWSVLMFEAHSREAGAWVKQKRFLTRSGNMPLEVHIIGAVCSGNGDPGLMASIADVIVPHATRFRTLYVEKEFVGYTSASLEAVQLLLAHLETENMPLLEELVLQAAPWDLEAHNGMVWNGLLHPTPRLRRVWLYNFPTAFESPMFNNLKEMYLEDPRLINHSDESIMSYILDFLLRSPDLQHLGVINPRRPGHGGWVVANAAPGELPAPALATMTSDRLPLPTKLRSLTLQYGMDSLAGLLLTKLRLPLLEDLDDCADSQPAVPPTALPALASWNPLTHLKSLSLHGRLSYGAQHHLVAALAPMENLESLSLLEFCLDGEEHVAALQKACPKLNDLSISGCLFPGISSVVDLLTTRKKQGYLQLQDLSITPVPILQEDLSEEDVNALEKIQGLVKFFAYELDD